MFLKVNTGVHVTGWADQWPQPSTHRGSTAISITVVILISRDTQNWTNDSLPSKYQPPLVHEWLFHFLFMWHFKKVLLIHKRTRAPTQRKCRLHPPGLGGHSVQPCCWRWITPNPGFGRCGPALYLSPWSVLTSFTVPDLRASVWLSLLGRKRAGLNNRADPTEILPEVLAASVWGQVSTKRALGRGASSGRPRVALHQLPWWAGPCDPCILKRAVWGDS